LILSARKLIRVIFPILQKKISYQPMEAKSYAFSS